MINGNTFELNFDYFTKQRRIQSEKKSISPEFYDKCLSFVYSEDLPLTTLDEPSFQGMMGSLLSHGGISPVISSKLVDGEVFAKAKRSKSLFVEIIRNQPFFSLALDSWTTSNDHDDLGLTCHYIDSNWNFKNIFLDLCFSVKHGSYLPEEQFQKLQSIFKDFGIHPSRVSCLVVEDQRTMTALNRQKTEEFRFPLAYCFDHLMELLTGEFLETFPEMKLVINKCRSLAETYEHSRYFGSEFHCFQLEMDKENDPIRLNYYHPIRWWSMWIVTTRMIQLKDPLTKFIESDRRTDFISSFTSEEWDLILIYTLILNVFMDLQIFFESEKDITLSLVPTMVRMIYKCILKITSGPYNAETFSFRDSFGDRHFEIPSHFLDNFSPEMIEKIQQIGGAMERMLTERSGIRRDGSVMNFEEEGREEGFRGKGEGEEGKEEEGEEKRGEKVWIKREKGEEVGEGLMKVEKEEKIDEEEERFKCVGRGGSGVESTGSSSVGGVDLFGVQGRVMSTVLLAAYLDPRTKSLLSLPSSQREAVKTRLREMLREEIMNLPLAPSSSSSSATFPSGLSTISPSSSSLTSKENKNNTKKMRFLLFGDEEEEVDEEAKEITETNEIDEEIERWNSLPQVHPWDSQGLLTSPFDWWKKHEIYFPKISQLAKKYLSIPANTKPNKKFFSEYTYNEVKFLNLWEEIDYFRARLQSKSGMPFFGDV